MGQLNWDEVLAVDSTSLENEEEKADMMFNVLVQVQIFIHQCLKHILGSRK